MRSQYSEMFLMLSIMVWSTLGVGGKPLCDPEENKYYHHQAGTCLQCERCLKGEEVISVEVWDKTSDLETGPTECRPCRRCQPGTYSDKRSYKCQPCRNCSLYGQYETSACTSKSDTVCDGVRSTTIRPNHSFTEKPDHPVSKEEGRKDMLYIAGIVCGTVFILVISLIVVLKIRKPCLQRELCKREDQNHPECMYRNEGDVLIIENEDSEPLLSAKVTALELQNDTSNSSCPNKCPSDPNDSSQRDVDCCSNKSASLNTSHRSRHEGFSNELDIETDGAYDCHSVRSKFLIQRQWSYPMDERSERIHRASDGKVTPMSPIIQESKDDICIRSVCLKENMALDDCQLRIVAKHLVVNRLYREVARDFKLEAPDIEMVKYNHQNDTVQETSYQMLLKIKQKKERITLGSLRKSVQKHDNTAWNGILQDLQS
uniref:Uncharacterized protein LOC111126363 n=1 Tax=Crassostrea virginica TaxID=6565 RepID=A0A8B8DI36_CRAVI|nr:uncharacterized protein LOC111126363 [Crassostrea virginica]XP_022326636.1 uncharacterized protein LOC111126363 [Crassostrea virginica]